MPKAIIVRKIFVSPGEKPRAGSFRMLRGKLAQVPGAITQDNGSDLSGSHDGLHSRGKAGRAMTAFLADGCLWPS
jgi:hypothetical protein